MVGILKSKGTIYGFLKITSNDEQSPRTRRSRRDLRVASHLPAGARAPRPRLGPQLRVGLPGLHPHSSIPARPSLRSLPSGPGRKAAPTPRPSPSGAGQGAGARPQGARGLAGLQAKAAAAEGGGGGSRDVRHRGGGGGRSAAGLDRGAAAQRAATQEGHYQVSARPRLRLVSCRT